jgi:hypothetical protein
MTESSSSRVLSFYERSQCMTNITLPDLPAGASTDFKIASQFDAVGSVDAVAFQVPASAARGDGARAAAAVAALVLGVLWPV